MRPHIDDAAHCRRPPRELSARKREFDIAKVQLSIGQRKYDIGRLLIAHGPEIASPKDNSELAGEVHDG